MFGRDGKNGLVTFMQREDQTCEAIDALARWLLEEHLAQDEAKAPGAKVDCRSAADRRCHGRRIQPYDNSTYSATWPKSSAIASAVPSGLHTAVCKPPPSFAPSPAATMMAR